MLGQEGRACDDKRVQGMLPSSGPKAKGWNFFPPCVLQVSATLEGQPLSLALVPQISPSAAAVCTTAPACPPAPSAPSHCLWLSRSPAWSGEETAGEWRGERQNPLAHGGRKGLQVSMQRKAGA